MTVPTDTDVRENTTSLILQKEHQQARKHSMSMEWTPGDIFVDYLAQSGIDYQKIHDNTRNEILGEFKSYWLTQPDRQHTENEWLHRLRSNFIRIKDRLYEQPKTTSLKNRDIEDQLSDRSWAFGTN